MGPDTSPLGLFLDKINKIVYSSAARGRRRGHAASWQHLGGPTLKAGTSQRTRQGGWNWMLKVCGRFAKKSWLDTSMLRLSPGDGAASGTSAACMRMLWSRPLQGQGFLDRGRVYTNTASAGDLSRNHQRRMRGTHRMGDPAPAHAGVPLACADRESAMLQLNAHRRTSSRHRCSAPVPNCVVMSKVNVRGVEHILHQGAPAVGQVLRAQHATHHGAWVL